MKKQDLVNQRKLDSKIEHIKDLLRKWNDLSLEIFEGLKEIEDEGLWKFQFSSFQDFLTKTFPNVIGFKHYYNVVKAVGIYGREVVQRMPIDACHAVINPAIVDDKQKRQKMTRIINDYYNANEVAPRTDFIRKQIREHITPELNKPHRSTRVLSELDTLTKERDELKIKCKKLEQQVKALTKENDGLKRQIERSKPAKKAA